MGLYCLILAARVLGVFCAAESWVLRWGETMSEEGDGVLYEAWMSLPWLLWAFSGDVQLQGDVGIVASAALWLPLDVP